MGSEAGFSTFDFNVINLHPLLQGSLRCTLRSAGIARLQRCTSERADSWLPLTLLHSTSPPSRPSRILNLGNGRAFQEGEPRPELRLSPDPGHDLFNFAAFNIL